MRVERVIQAVDLHAAGEHARVIVGGVLDVPGDSMFEKMQHLERHADGLRKLMLREPRGYPAANCNLILPPTVPEADAGFVIMEQTEYPPMSGHNTICTVTALIETGMVASREPVTELTLETPAGLLGVQARVEGGKVTEVTFENVPAFPVHLGATVEIPTLGAVEVDVSWGGMFFAIADARRFGVSIRPENGRDMARLGAMVKQAAREQLEAVHPENPQIRRASIGMITEPFDQEAGEARNAVTVATGELDWDRPATWTGALDRSPLRHRHLGAHGRAPRPRRTGHRRGLPPLRPAGHRLHRTPDQRDHRWRNPGRGPHHLRHRLDHRHGPVRAGPHRPVPRGLHHRRHLGIGGSELGEGKGLRFQAWRPKLGHQPLGRPRRAGRQLPPVLHGWISLINSMSVRLSTGEGSNP